MHADSASDPTLGATPFGDMLREYRMRAGLSQEQLAEKAQLSAAAVGALERGIRRNPYRSTVSVLAKALALDDRDTAALEAARKSKRVDPATTETGGYLALQRTSFVGRDADISRIIELLERSALVTLVGPGGIGKTRASIETARCVAGNRWDEVWFIDLAALDDGAFIAAKIASAIQPPLTDRVETIAALASALATRSMLLIFDNCEHIIADVACAAHTILKTCPHIAILATSRERLNIAGEFVYRLQALSLPEHTPDRLEDAQAYSAVDLFVQCAEAADPRVTFDSANVGAIVDICRRLDGLPLALELAAGQLPAMGLKMLQARIDERFHIAAGRRDLPARQQTLMATIAWSYELLAQDERDVLDSVSIFSGGFTLEAAEAVCSIDVEPPAILGDLSSLVNKSLVNVVPTTDGVRYTLLDSVRAFGLERLHAAGKETRIARRHAQWVAAVAADIAADYNQQAEATFIALIPEFDNVRAAIVWSLNAPSQDDRGLAAAIITRLFTLWSVTGRREEHRQWVEKALACLDETRHPTYVARLLENFIHRAHYELAVLPAIDRAIPLFERIDDPRGQASFHALLACVFAEHGKLLEAEQSSERASAMMTEQGLERTHYFATLLLNNAVMRIHQARLDDARADLAAAQRIFVSLADRYSIVCRCSPRLFQIEYAAGNTRRALEIAEGMLASEYGVVAGVAIQAVEAITNLRLLVGDVDAAIESARELLGRMRLSNGFAVVYAAIPAALRGNAVAACRLKGFVDACDARVPVHRDAIRQATYDLLCATLAQQLESDAIAAACERGAMLGADEAITEALALLNS